MQVLTWLKAHTNAIKFGKDCWPGRMLMLVHGFGLQPSAFAKRVFREVECRHLALRSVVRQQDRQHPEETCLADLPPELLKDIFFEAGIDFSWHLNEEALQKRN